MIQDKSTYQHTDTLRDIIRDNTQLLTVLTRFNISLGFGDDSVDKVCADNGVDTDTFLAVINFMAGKKWQQYNVSLTALIAYLRMSHSRLIDYSLPSIKKILIEGINEAEASEIAMIILRFFDEYMDQVRRHMGYEDSVIFSYAEKLLDGQITEGFRISDFSSSHSHLTNHLDDLKELFIYKYKQRNNEQINTALLQLIMCGQDLHLHCDIENQILFPAIARLEKDLRTRRREENTEDNREQEPSENILSEREREVIRWIALGLSTKEIADRMCISTHTVTTHRKNIASKLNIHTPTGIAFYAVLHHIIDITEVTLT